MSLLSIKGSRNLFNNMMHTMLNMPLRWIDTTPVGRMLNRVTGDISVIEDALGSQFSSAFSSGLFLVAVVAAALFASPLVLIFGAVFLGIAGYFTRFYLAAAREAKRLASVTKSPILDLVSISRCGFVDSRTLMLLAWHCHRRHYYNQSFWQYADLYFEDVGPHRRSYCHQLGTISEHSL